jgi:hypothetical protein
MRETIFQSKQDMTDPAHGEASKRTAMSIEGHMENMRPHTLRDPEKDVQNLQRPRRGYGY